MEKTAAGSAGYRCDRDIICDYHRGAEPAFAVPRSGDHNSIDCALIDAMNENKDKVKDRWGSHRSFEGSINN